jgi:hypothetical protein
MRPTSLIGLAGLIVVGVIIADLIVHPQGTTAAANGINTLAKTTTSGLLGAGAGKTK